MTRMLATISIALLLTACGSDDNDTAAYTFNLELGDVIQGVANVNITVTSNNDSELPDSNIQVSPLMVMNSGMEHGTPLENASGQLNDDGTFTSTAYFLMPSNMPSGMAMGDWSINVEFDGQEQKFPVTVDMSTSDVKKLYGDDSDQIMDMEDATNSLDRTYYIFDLGRHINNDMSMNTFSVYVAARESMMNYQAVAEQNILNSGAMYELNIASVIVKMCIDSCDIESNWVTAVADSDNQGIYKGMDLGLAGDDTDTINVRVFVNTNSLDDGDDPVVNTAVEFTFDETTSSSSMSY